MDQSSLSSLETIIQKYVSFTKKMLNCAPSCSLQQTGSGEEPGREFWVEISQLWRMNDRSRKMRQHSQSAHLLKRQSDEEVKGLFLSQPAHVLKMPRNKQPGFRLSNEIYPVRLDKTTFFQDTENKQQIWCYSSRCSAFLDLSHPYLPFFNIFI